MTAESDSYFDLNFGLCSQTARRDDPVYYEDNTDNVRIITSSQNLPTESFITPDKPGAPGGTHSSVDYSHHSYSRYLLGRAQRDFQTNQDNEITDENPIGDLTSKKEKSLWNDVNIMSARELPHPKYLKKRKRSRMGKQEKTERKPRCERGGVTMDNQIKQLKFYCSRVLRAPPVKPEASSTYKIKSLTLDDIEIPPLPEMPKAFYQPARREMFNFNPQNFDVNPQTLRDLTPEFNRFQFPSSDLPQTCQSMDINPGSFEHNPGLFPSVDPRSGHFPSLDSNCRPFPAIDSHPKSFQPAESINAFHPPLSPTFRSASRRLNFDDCVTPKPWNQENYMEDQSVGERTDEQEWFSQNWRPRCVFTPGKEE